MNNNGVLGRGAIVFEKPNKLVWGWQAIKRTGGSNSYRIDFVFSDAHEYRMLMYEIKGDGQAKERFNALFVRGG